MELCVVFICRIWFDSWRVAWGSVVVLGGDEGSGNGWLRKGVGRIDGIGIGCGRDVFICCFLWDFVVMGLWGRNDLSHAASQGVNVVDA